MQKQQKKKEICERGENDGDLSQLCLLFTLFVLPTLETDQV